MEIRKTTTNDIDAVMDVFAAAKRYMRANGNASQRGATTTPRAASRLMISRAAAAMC